MKGRLRKDILMVCSDLPENKFEMLGSYINYIENSIIDIELEIEEAMDGNIKRLEEAIHLASKLKNSLY